MVQPSDGEFSAAFHTFCLSPPLESIPDGDWFCPHCANSSKENKINTYSMRKVGAILGRRSTAEGFQYLIKWESLSHRQDAWVSCCAGYFLSLCNYD